MPLNRWEFSLNFLFLISGEPLKAVQCTVHSACTVCMAIPLGWQVLPSSSVLPGTLLLSFTEHTDKESFSFLRAHYPSLCVQCTWWWLEHTPEHCIAKNSMSGFWPSRADSCNVNPCCVVKTLQKGFADIIRFSLKTIPRGHCFFYIAFFRGKPKRIICVFIGQKMYSAWFGLS